MKSLVCRNISKSFISSNGQTVKALTDVSLSFGNTGLVFIVGKSGAGKSTLLNCLAGIEKPTSGHILFDDKDITSFNEKELNNFRNNHIGLCFQESNLINELTVEENICLSSPLKNESQNIKKLLDSVSLTGYEKRNVVELSGGEQQRVAIARCLFKQSNIILADEPTGSLDKGNSRLVFEALVRVSKTRLVIVISHDEKAASKYADRIINIEGGSIQKDELLHQSVSQNINNESLSKRFSLTPRIASKLAIKSLLKMPVRLSFTILLIGLCLGALGPVLGTTLRNNTNMLYDSVLSSTDKYVSLTKWRIGHGNCKSFPQDLEDASNKYETSFIPVYNPTSSQMNYSCVSFANYDIDAVNTKETSVDLALQSSSLGVAPITQSTLDIFPLVAGHLPESISECVISKAEYDIYARRGFVSSSNLRLTPSVISTPDLFVKKKPSININCRSTYNMTIVGIVDTSFDVSSYPSNITSGTAQDYAVQAQLSEETFYGPHSLVFVSEDFIEQEFGETTSFSLSPLESVQVSINNYSQSFDTISQANDMAYAFSSSKEGIYLPLGSFGELYKNSALVLPKTATKDFTQCTNYLTEFSKLPESSTSSESDYLFSSPIDYSSTLSLTSCGEYVAKNGLPVGSNLASLTELAQKDYDNAFSSSKINKKIDFSSNTDYTNDILKSFYVFYLSSRYLHFNSGSFLGEGGYKQNSYGDVSGHEIVESFVKNLFLTNSLNPQNITIKEEKERTVPNRLSGPVIGLCLSSDLNPSSNELVLSNSLFTLAQETFGDSGPIATIIAPTSSLKKHLAEIISSSNDKSITPHYTPHNRSIASYNYFGEYISSGLQELLITVSIVLIVASLVLLINMMVSASAARSKEIIILRCQGCSKAMASLQFFYESLFITIAGFLLSLIVAVILTVSLNAYIVSYLGISLSFFSFSPLSALILLAIAIAGSLASSLEPYFSSKKKSLSSLLKRE
jgi:ABC-type lipoprotein export system ATPase subunit